MNHLYVGCYADVYKAVCKESHFRAHFRPVLYASKFDCDLSSLLTVKSDSFNIDFSCPCVEFPQHFLAALKQQVKVHAT